MITCRERAGLLALLCVVFFCAFVTFTYGVPVQIWYLVVSLSLHLSLLLCQNCKVSLTMLLPNVNLLDNFNAELSLINYLVNFH